MKILLLQSLLADYRVPVFQSLCDQLGKDFLLGYGVSGNNTGFNLRDIPESHRVRVKNLFFLKRRLQFQVGMWKKALSSDVVILEMNPRIISTWILLFLRKLLRKPSVLWGHAWPRTGSGSRSDVVRNLLRSLGDVVLVYTEAQAVELKVKMPRKRILAAPNALYSRQLLADNIAELSSASRKRKDIIFVGRLVPEKKPRLLLEAFIPVADELGEDARLIFVGDGPERASLEEIAASSPFSGRIIFKGHISEPDQLSELYSGSMVSVSPGYAGLSITQSFAYGVPILIARNEPHAPEIEAAVDGFNCLWFESDSVTALGGALKDAFAQREKWAQNSLKIIQDCSERYSIELMTSRMIEAARIACRQSS